MNMNKFETSIPFCHLKAITGGANKLEREFAEVTMVHAQFDLARIIMAANQDVGAKKAEMVGKY